MLHLLPAVVLALCPVQDAVKRQDRVRDFVKAFFREDEKTLLAVSSGRLQADLKAYFWIRRRIHGDKAAEPRAWNGEITILRSARRKVLAIEGGITESEAEIFELSVDGTLFQCGLDDEQRAILFSDPPK
ncbi:MAG TPA: hypothetical protein VNM14_25830 [Planctomycetota bacterium]|nr:hypothetical protein [Planctomycetota bacterium]